MFQVVPAHGSRERASEWPFIGEGDIIPLVESLIVQECPSHLRQLDHLALKTCQVPICDVDLAPVPDHLNG